MTKVYASKNLSKASSLLLCAILVVLGCTSQNHLNSTTLYQNEPGGQESPVPRADLAVHGGGAYVAVSKDLESKTTYLETGRTAREAVNAALSECEAFADNRSGCVVIRAYETSLTPRIDGDPSKEWGCFAQEARLNSEDLGDIRSWLAHGTSVGEAKKKALALCTSEAGNDCRILRCFNADQDKI
jgi:hypothetical protein